MISKIIAFFVKKTATYKSLLFDYGVEVITHTETVKQLVETINQRDQLQGNYNALKALNKFVVEVPKAGTYRVEVGEDFNLVLRSVRK